MNGTVTMLAAKGKIKRVTFNAPDGDREGVVEQFWDGDVIIVKSWPVGTGRKGDVQRYMIQCKNYAMGGNYPTNVFWAPCTMVPEHYYPNTDEYVMSAGGSLTEGTIFFYLQPSKPEANSSVVILVVAIASLIYLI